MMETDSRASRPVRAAVAAVAAILALSLAACATGPGSKAGSSEPADPGAGEAGVPAALRERAVERWQLLIAGKPSEAYELLAPGYRSTRNVDAYVQTFRPGLIQWREVEWRGAECVSPDSCEVRLLLSYTATIKGAGDAFSVREVRERWLRSEGGWHHLPDR